MVQREGGVPGAHELFGSGGAAFLGKNRAAAVAENVSGAAGAASRRVEGRDVRCGHTVIIAGQGARHPMQGLGERAASHTQRRAALDGQPAYAEGMRAFSTDPDEPRSHYERMVDGDWYIANDPRLAREYGRALEVTARFAAEYPRNPAAAQEILRELLGQMGPGVHVRPPLFVDYGSRLFIGEGTFINFNLTALDVADIRIGKNCQLGPNIQLLTPIHPLEPQPRRDGWESAEPILIEDNVWIGGGATVLGPVRIGENSVIGAGTVVTRDVPPNSIAVGNPARVIRTLPEG